MKAKESPDTEFSSIHAEMSALLKAKRVITEDNWDKAVKKMKMFITRANASGNNLLARPCVNCQRTLKKSGFLAKNIWFTDNFGNWTCLGKYDEVE